jgi:hypothetical protein
MQAQNEYEVGGHIFGLPESHTRRGAGVLARIAREMTRERRKKWEKNGRKHQIPRHAI